MKNKNIKQFKSQKENLLKKKEITGLFSLIALAGGFIFLNSGRIISGNVVYENVNPSFSFISLIGLLLIFCSIILALYSIKKR